MKTKIGVIAIQGNVSEPVSALEKTLVERGERGEVVTIKHQGTVPTCDALVIPGGESTTIGRFLQRESFEVMLPMRIFDEPFPAVFIRAPAITQVSERHRGDISNIQ